MKNSYDSVPDRHLDEVLASHAERKERDIKVLLASIGVVAVTAVGVVGMIKLGANFNDPAGPTFNNSGSHEEVKPLQSNQLELPEQYDGQVNIEQSTNQ
jgi:hypothetical protein